MTKIYFKQKESIYSFLQKETRKCILLALLSLINLSILAQKESIQRLNIKSPEAAAFEKVGDIPVSRYTGVPNISIPIYTINSGGISLPISLDYHARAINVDQEATWVGLNWNLNAGGVITTKIPQTNVNEVTDVEWNVLYNLDGGLTIPGSNPYGLDNFHYKISGSHGASYWTGKYGNTMFINNPTEPATDPLTESNDIGRNAYQNIIAYHKGEAQLCSANFLGYSFNFIYHPLQKKFIVIGKDQNFKIEGNEYGIGCITDTKGFKYYFTTIERITQDQAPSNKPQYPYSSATYFLTDIVSPTGKRISLQYKNYGYITTIGKVNESVYKNNPTKIDYLVERDKSPGCIIQNYYLYKIESEDTKIQFNVSTRNDIYGDGARKLDNLEIYDKLNNKIIKRFVFDYEYFQGNNVGGEAIYDYHKWSSVYFNTSMTPVQFTHDQLYSRLKLSSIHEEAYNTNGAKVLQNPYQFSYDGTSLPSKTSAAVDYWGNYNGQENSGGDYYHRLITRPSFDGESGKNLYPLIQVGADNRYNSSTVTACLLTNVKYPIGGYTSFVYEPNSFSNYKYYEQGQNLLSIFTPQTVIMSNINSMLPPDQITPKEFTIDREKQINFKTNISNPLAYYWKGMLGATAILFKLVLKTNQYSQWEQPEVCKSWTLADTTDLIGKDTKNWDETIVLQPGKYRMAIYSNLVQTTPINNPLFKGSRNISISATSTDYTLSEGCGVRIKSISEYDGLGHTSTKEYRYRNADGATSGILMDPLIFSRKKIMLFTSASTPNVQVYPTEYQQMASSNFLPENNGVGYSCVEEAEITNDGNNGKKVYKFWNNPDLTFDCNKPLSDPRNGNLLNEAVYDKYGVVKKDVVNEYSILKNDAYFVNAVIEDIWNGPDDNQNWIGVCPSGRALIYIYPSTKYWIPMTKSTEKNYTTQGIITNITNYAYNPHNLEVSSVQKSMSSNSIEKTTTDYFIYPQDYNTDNKSYPYNLVDKHIVSAPIEIVSCKNTPTSTVVTDGIINQYNDNGQVTANQKLEIQDKIPLLGFKFSNKANMGVFGTAAVESTTFTPFSKYVTDVTCDYSNVGNLIYYNRKDADKVVYLWSYSATLPVAKIEGLTYAQVVSLYPQTSIDDLANKLNPTISDINEIRSALTSQQALVTTYTYIPLVGMFTATDPRGITTSYSYDTFNRLMNIKNQDANLLKTYNYHYKQ